MADAISSSGMPIDRHGVRVRTLARVVLALCLLGTAAYVTAIAINTAQQRNSVTQSQADTVAAYGLTNNGSKHLAAKFTDKQGRLLADAPASPEQWINPDTIVVAHIAGVDETPGTSWADWEAGLSRRIGKKVVDQTYTNSADQVAMAASGKVTLLALHPADAPFLVNNYGFEPLAVLGNETGINGNRLDIIVPADSPIAAPADLKGRRLVCTVPSSITGYRAGIATLAQNFALRPNTDYEVNFSLGQKHSITGVAEKKYDAAAVSDEKLQTLLADGTVSASQYKVIYQSQVIPRTTIGCFYNLNPELTEKLRQAATLAGDSTTATTKGSNPLRFLPVDYNRDFQFVRTMDDLFDPRFDAQKTRHTD